MTRLLATTALSVALALPAAAQQGTAAPAAPQMETAGTFVKAAGPTDYLATELVGQDIFTAEREYEPGMNVGEDDVRQWEDAGEIEDVLITADRRVKAVVVDVGGFLGIGDKRVAIQADDIRFVREETSGERFIVFRSNREDLESAPEFVGAAEVARAWAERAASDPAGGGVFADREGALPQAANPELDDENFNEMGGETQAQKLRMHTAANKDAGPVEPGEKARTTDARGSAQIAQQPADGMVEPSDPNEVIVETEPAMADAEVMEVDPDAQEAQLDLGRRMVTMGGGVEVSMDRLEGADVFGDDGEEIGEMVGFDRVGDASAAIIEIGGWLGLGQHRVAVPMHAVSFRANDGDDDFSVYVHATEEELESMPEYERQG